VKKITGSFRQLISVQINRMLDWKLATGTGVRGSKIKTAGKKEEWLKISERKEQNLWPVHMIRPVILNPKKDFFLRMVEFPEQSNIHLTIYAQGIVILRTVWVMIR
jgi:hypothetical protein